MAQPLPHVSRIHNASETGGESGRDAAAPPPRTAVPPLLRLAADGARPGQIADAAVREWTYVHTELAPLIGQHGASSLYRRVLHLARADRPWLDAAFLGDNEPGDFTSLHTALSQQDSVLAAGAHDEMLRGLRSLLTNFIGLSLTDRLLPATSVFHSPGAAAKEGSS